MPIAVAIFDAFGKVVQIDASAILTGSSFAWALSTDADQVPLISVV